jgi:hypothetical protein
MDPGMLLTLLEMRCERVPAAVGKQVKPLKEAPPDECILVGHRKFTKSACMDASSGILQLAKFQALVTIGSRH